MSRSFNSYLIAPHELHEALQKDHKNNIVPVSAAWFLPNDAQSRTGNASFIKSHIANSRFFDLDKIADTSSPYPHMLPDAQTFALNMNRLGIRNSDTVVVYDTPELGLFSAPRVAWTFRVFGHAGSVHVLNNYKLWVEQGLPTDEGEQETLKQTAYDITDPKLSMVADFEAVHELAKSNAAGKCTTQSQAVILDARSKGRWAGTDPEPRKGLSSGHMPGSISVPFTDLLDPSTKAMKSKEELLALFNERGVDFTRPIITSCGTGVTAAVIETALMQAGFNAGNIEVYDGSWTEWAQRISPAEDLIRKSQQA